MSVRIPSYEELRDRELTGLEQLALAAMRFNTHYFVNSILVGKDGFIRFANIEMVTPTIPKPIIYITDFKSETVSAFLYKEIEEEEVEKREFRLWTKEHGIFIYMEL